MTKYISILRKKRNTANSSDTINYESVNTCSYSSSSVDFNIDTFIDSLDVPLLIRNIEYDSENGCTFYFVYRKDYSTTCFVIACYNDDSFEIEIDLLASFDDYRFFPYLADCLNQYINGEHLYIEGKSVFEEYGENWAADSIGEEVALLKSTLSILPKYYIDLPLVPNSYISKEILAEFGVSIYSSTPRIHGYIQYIIKNGIVPVSTPEEAASEYDSYSMAYEANPDAFEADVPQHVSIGRVKSWQVDGSETWESYSREDIEMLLDLAGRYLRGQNPYLPGVVMNDLGTIYQEGIGVPVDGYKAEFWFSEAVSHGDTLYAASNLGDLYRKGCGSLPASLPKAFEAYRKSTDYYAMYRIGQAYEEGWTGKTDMDEAIKWYRKAASFGHHLALKRIERGF